MLRSRVRNEVGDTETSAANQRWGDSQIDQRINDILFWMYNKLGIDPSVFALASSMTYTAAAASVALPAAAHANSIIKIEDYDDPTNPVTLQRVDLIDIETWARPSLGRPFPRPCLVWARTDTSIAVRPTPQANKTLRVWYIGNPWSLPGLNGVAAGTPATDQHPLPVSFEELIVLGAATKLYRTDDETPVQMLTDLAEMKQDFDIYAAAYRGPLRVRSRRRWR